MRATPLAAAALLFACTSVPAPTGEAPTAETPTDMPAIIGSGPVCELVSCDGRSEIVYGPLSGPLDFGKVEPTVRRLTDVGEFCTLSGAVLTGSITVPGYDAVLERYLEATTDALSAFMPRDAIQVASGIRVEDTIGGIAPPEPLAAVEIVLVSQHPNPDCR